ncbi:uncharacterized protein LOC112086805 [Eutrema salsugineum]|uniref:uncharacterized protein LOC112086805 n=1 Tax=Eutrema salsugineum TaxID=72664 RepID=UPI000CED5236|nr:uncharacterized protein LOC112086805 [Eutrema salsugineum]
MVVGLQPSMRWKGDPRRSIIFEGMIHPPVFVTVLRIIGGDETSRRWRLFLFQCGAHSLYCLSSNTAPAPELNILTPKSNKKRPGDDQQNDPDDQQNHSRVTRDYFNDAKDAGNSLGFDLDTHLEGENFLNTMVEYFIKLTKKKQRKNNSKDKEGLGKLGRECESAKKAPSSQHQVLVEIESLW